MGKRLFIKFIITYLLFFLFSFLFLYFYGEKAIGQNLYQREGQELYSEATRLANYYSKEENGALSLDRLSKEMEGNIHRSNVEWTLVDKDGKILQHKGKDNLSGKTVSGFDPTENGGKIAFGGNLHGLLPEEHILAQAPIQRNYQNLAYLILHKSVAGIEQEKAMLLSIFYRGFLAVAVLSLSIFFVFYFLVYQPLGKITAGAVHYAAGEYLYRISVGGGDEMSYLADTLNFMAEEIQKSDDYQRQFIANVSHDFRSPLTSIKGYLEAMLDGTIPKDAEEKYLLRLISETERLSKLTQSMLSLNKLDQGSSLNRSNFDLNRMIREVCASFEMQCQKKKLGFSLVFAEKKQMVNGDYPKIQQVFYNLLDNAVKFSREDSEIQIRTEQKGTKVLVGIKDQGIGIPKKDLGKIWERFYKTDISRGKDKAGTGLGLAIVKSIITAHGENIDCVSTEGVGTEFSFSLPAVERVEE